MTMRANYVNANAENWYRSVTENLAEFPFAFVYDGKKYEGFSGEFFTLTEKKTVTEAGKETTDYVFSFAGQLQVTLDADTGCFPPIRRLGV